MNSPLSRGKGELAASLDELRLNHRHWLVFAVCAAGFMFDALDIQIMAVAAPLIAAEWKLVSRAMGLPLSSMTGFRHRWRQLLPTAEPESHFT
jgi:hypothetical protein